MLRKRLRLGVWGGGGKATTCWHDLGLLRSLGPRIAALDGEGGGGGEGVKAIFKSLNRYCTLRDSRPSSVLRKIVN